MPARLQASLLLVCLGQAAAAQTCVEAKVGSERAYQCVNEALARLAHSSKATNTLDATAPAPAVGTFSRAATVERMGNAFGHSVIAQRPPPPVYATPLLGPQR